MPATHDTETKSDASGESRSTQRNLKGSQAAIIYWAGVLMALFHLWVNTIGIMPEIQRNAIHFAFILFMGFIIYPVSRKFARHPNQTKI